MLNNEQVESVNYGIVYMLSWVEGFDLLIDFIKIDIFDVIVEFLIIDILNVCYDVIDFLNFFCSQFNCMENGQFFGVNVFIFGYVNVVLCNFEGIEYVVNYCNEFLDYLLVGSFFGEGSGDLNWLLCVFKQCKNEILNIGFDFIDDIGQWNDLDLIVNL